MSYVFSNREKLIEAINLYCSNQEECIKKYGDCNTWNVSKVTDMSFMFYKSQFNSNISNWNVSKVTNMRRMFLQSQFNGDISKWNISNVTNMDGMFINSKFNGDISKWNIESLKNGREDVIKMMKSNVKDVYVVKELNPDMETCPVTHEPITGDYIQCNQCSKCFDILVKNMWIKDNNTCPHCRSVWINNTIYSQPANKII